MKFNLKLGLESRPSHLLNQVERTKQFFNPETQQREKQLRCLALKPEAIRCDGTVVTWGHRNCGGNCRKVQQQLQDVWHICPGNVPPPLGALSFCQPNKFLSIEYTAMAIVWLFPPQKWNNCWSLELGMVDIGTKMYTASYNNETGWSMLKAYLPMVWVPTSVCSFSDIHGHCHFCWLPCQAFVLPGWHFEGESLLGCLFCLSSLVDLEDCCGVHCGIARWPPIRDDGNSNANHLQS